MRFAKFWINNKSVLDSSEINPFCSVLCIKNIDGGKNLIQRTDSLNTKDLVIVNLYCKL